MDEFDKINGFDITLKEEFRSIFMQSETVNYLRLIATGGELEIWDRSSPFNFLIEVDIAQLSSEEARQLILTSSRGVVIWEESVVDYILESSGRIPFEIQKLCSSLVDYALEHKLFTIDDVVLQNVLLNKTRIDNEARIAREDSTRE